MKVEKEVKKRKKKLVEVCWMWQTANQRIVREVHAIYLLSTCCGPCFTFGRDAQGKGRCSYFASVVQLLGNLVRGSKNAKINADQNSRFPRHGRSICKISLKRVWCVAQASVMRMLSTGKAWIVRKTVPVYALLTHYQRFIYASYILNPYIESALFKIRSFKRLISFSQVYAGFALITCLIA